jgi:signal transduction histidine kinase
MRTSGPEPDALLATPGWAPPDVLAGLGVISRVARALVGAASLPDLAQRGLGEMREALGLEVATLYLPAASGRPVLVREVSAAAGTSERRAGAQIAFDEEAWRLAVASGVPLIFHEEGSWLVANPFEPAATFWVVLPLTSEGRLLGVVVAASGHPLALDPAAATVLTLIGDLLTVGIATAELRQALGLTELERERSRLAALVHDGLAQDLALAVRELALLDAAPDPETSRASRDRLRQAVTSAHITVRKRLKELLAPVPIGGIRDAVREICQRFEHHGMLVRLDVDGPDPQVAPATVVAVVRVLTEALANVEKHAGAVAVAVRISVEDERLTLTVGDQGPGFAVERARGPDDGHLGLTLMRECAYEGGGALDLTSAPGRGTLVRLRMPT